MGFGQTFTTEMTLNDREDFLSAKTTSRAKAIKKQKSLIHRILVTLSSHKDTHTHAAFRANSVRVNTPWMMSPESSLDNKLRGDLWTCDSTHGLEKDMTD